MKGKFRKAAKIVRTIGFSHIPQLVQIILTNTYFLFLQRPWKQVQGACIGMPCAGILCDIVAAFEEFLWAVTYNMLQDQRHLHGHAHDLFVMRYVDNRLNLIDQMIQGHSGVKALRCLDFYKDPIILEHLADALQKAGDVQEARRVWQQALEGLDEEQNEERDRIKEKLQQYVLE